MASKTFENLPNEKKQRIQEALLKEFSNHSLPNSQVARIVKDAGIARGAFYKYFDDLGDAYNYELNQALKTIHMPLSDSPMNLGPEKLIQIVNDFLDQSENSEFRNLMKLHFLKNQFQIDSDSDDNRSTENEIDWATNILIHQTIREVLLHPTKKNEYLKRLNNSLQLIMKGK